MDINIKTTILIIDSCMETANKLSIELNNIGFKTTFATTKKRVYEELTLEQPNIILYNCNIDFDSNESLIISIQEKFILEFTSIIAISNDSTLEDKLFYLTSGANDFMSNQIIFSELVARINIQLKILDKYTKLQQKNSLLKEQQILCKKLAMTDELTGLYNKRYLLERLKIELNYSQKYKQPLSLMMIDIDYFKNINDTYGHLAGDIVLKETADTIYKFLRESDIFIRYGGEEFIMVLPNTPLSISKNLAERIRKKVSQSIIKLNHVKIKITISIGISRFIKNKGNSYLDEINKLIHEADLALYSAKSTGRNKTIIYPFKLINHTKIFNENFSTITKKTIP
jgi:diguanylate cyclase (GGDEF)-like protein